MQAIAASFGASVVRAPTLVHGEASEVTHDGAGLLAGMPLPFPAARYHSLCVEPARSRGDAVTAMSDDDGVVMGIRHTTLPLEGVQFHPESVLTPQGPHMLANFLRLAGEGEAIRLESRAGRSLQGIATPCRHRVPRAPSGRGRPMSEAVRAALAAIVEGRSLTHR